MESIEVLCSCGKIRGRVYNDHLEYRGIKYATANRWEYPNLIDHWDEVYDATEFKDCSYQRRSFEDDAICNKFYHKEFRENLSFTYSEDSLYLNIYSPKDPKNCPILIYIHGGSFTGGSSNESHINGTEFAKAGIIFVSFNYRLGPFGFCSHPLLTDENGVCGNYGLFDQYAAIQWIRENISSFGGNFNKITLMGQSAGAMSVDIHSSCPLEKDWFSGLMLSSGAGLQRCTLRPRTPKKTISFWNRVIQEAHVTSMEELKHVDPKTLYYAWLTTCKRSKFSLPYTLPVFDGKLLTQDTFTKKRMTNVPCIIGMTKTDMMPVILKHSLLSWGKAALRSHNDRCYYYLFHHDLPGDSSGAWHSCDLLYFFSTLKENWRPFDETDYKLSKQMSDSLIAFTKQANPNNSSIPVWEAGYKKPMIFCEQTHQDRWIQHKSLSKMNA